MSQSEPDGELILEVTSAGRGDRSPRQYVSAAMLQHYQRCEAMVVTDDFGPRPEVCYTAGMYCKIKRLRRGGERMEDREIAANPGLVATVTMATVEGVVVIEAFEPGIGGRRTLICPPMWRARVVSMHGDKMLVQGLERIGNQDDPNSAVQKQEWAVQVMVDQPEELARMPHRPPV